MNVVLEFIDEHPLVFVLSGLAVQLLVLKASVLYRLSHDKPVLFFGVPDALFQERAASSRYDRWWALGGGANNCLVVALTRDKLIVRPWFPFTLMFMPELFGLEHEVPFHRIYSVSEESRFFVKLVRISYQGADKDRTLLLALRKREEFLRVYGELKRKA